VNSLRNINMQNIRYFNGGTLILIFSDMIIMTVNTRISEAGACYKAGFPRASPEPMWIQYEACVGVSGCWGEMSTRSQKWHTVPSRPTVWALR
jgi:hypothetical protein